MTVRACEIVPADKFADACDTVELDHDQRYRRRIALIGEKGTAFLLDLPEAVALRDGDGLRLEDGRVVTVRAAAEDLVKITASDSHHLTRLSWHIGNRHLPAQIEADHILIRPDHVIAAMLEGLGATVEAVRAPFEPEGGAYAHGGGHHHGHDHD